MNVRGRKIFVGLSGGVDSAVSAALLKQRGAEVVGVFIKGWYPPGMPCSWASDRRDAMRVAAALGIPFTTLDASDEYKQGVIDYLLAEYRAGRTPNPDVMCNREVKFGAFHRFASDKGADFIATGHYARVRNLGADVHLVRGVDHAKDQSYFLWAVTPAALGMTVFPVGELKKNETRTLAKKFRLPVAEKRDSQGICFLGSISVDDFLRSEFGTEEGKAVDEKGNDVGVHDSALFYTIGERAALRNAAPGPWYVVAKDIERNILTVAHEHVHPSTLRSIRLRDTNWFVTPRTDELYDAQYRYHGPVVRGMVSLDRSEFIPSDVLPEYLASGQSLVLYEGEECIGGGIIV